MTIKEFQDWVQADWEKGGNTPDPHLQLLYLIEEFGEVAEAIRKNDGHKTRTTDTVDLEGELGDLFLNVCSLASSYGISMESAAIKTKAKIEQRHADGH